jgi:hypothetical protein
MKAGGKSPAWEVTANRNGSANAAGMPPGEAMKNPIVRLFGKPVRDPNVYRIADHFRFTRRGALRIAALGIVAGAIVILLPSQFVVAKIAALTLLAFISGLIAGYAFPMFIPAPQEQREDALY